MGGLRECTYVVAAGQAIMRPSASDLVEERVRPPADGLDADCRALARGGGERACVTSDDCCRASRERARRES